tara:strand:+ start:845 stop:2032 length:1188 start_codon:yes stop_codon:yes gene_type:complete
LLSDNVITNDQEVVDICLRIKEIRSFCLDLEFITEERYVPELSLIQLSWVEKQSIEVSVVAIDPFEVDVSPIIGIVDDPTIEMIVHSGQADIALLHTRFQSKPRGIVDTQIAAGFLGLGDQIGYAPLLEKILDIKIDKSSQYTEWSKRPLDEEQIRYALDDVRYLPLLWETLKGKLAQLNREEWFFDECNFLSNSWSQKIDPERMYTKVKGWASLNAKARGILQHIASWREKESLSSNNPPGWIMNDRTLLELCRRAPATIEALSSIRGIGKRTIDRYGSHLLLLAREGKNRKVPRPENQSKPSRLGQSWPAILSGIVQARCKEASISPRFVATRAEIDMLITWWLSTDRGIEPDLRLLQGWRREIAGQDILSWLSGETSVVVDSSSAGIKIEYN